MTRMVVDHGKYGDKAQLAADLRRLAGSAVDLNLWVDGRQFASTLGDVAYQLEENIRRRKTRELGMEEF